MATQLARKNPIEMIQERMPLFLSARAMIGVFAAVVALGLLGLLAGIHNANRAEDAARRQFADAQALASLPPASTDSIQEDLTIVRNQLATAQAVASPQAIDASADATTTQLVKAAQAAGLTVKAITGVAPGESKVGENSYTTNGVRVTVDGSAGQITGFLEGIGRSQPALIPSVTTMTFNDAGIARAELVFTTFKKVVPPTPAPALTPKAKKN